MEYFLGCSRNCGETVRQPNYAKSVLTSNFGINRLKRKSKNFEMKKSSSSVIGNHIGWQTLLVGNHFVTLATNARFFYIRSFSEVTSTAYLTYVVVHY
jgi:hypothetical protein